MVLERTRRYARFAIYFILIVGSLLFLLGIGGLGVPAGGQEDRSLTTLTYGLELEGGARITAPLDGYVAEGVQLPSGVSEANISQQVASNLKGADARDIQVYNRPSTGNGPSDQIEVTATSVTKKEFAQALQASGIKYDRVRDGVTKETRQQAVRVIESKISQAGLSAGSVRQVETTGGQNLILIQVPDKSREEVRNLLKERGEVRIDIYYPTGNGEYKTKEAVLTQEDFKRIGSVQGGEGTGTSPRIPVTLTQEGAREFSQAVEETGIAPGGSQCSYRTNPNSTGPCLLTKVDGEVVYAAGMEPSLAESIASGQWQKNPQFVLQTRSIEKANEVALHLRAGRLPASIEFSEATSVYISPSQGQEFKKGSALIALIAMLAVGLKVYTRYRDIRVVAPMLAMALTEVVILLGFATFTGYPISLSVIAGLIAVIGTGVDDLIIITNEVFSKEDLNSQRIFRKRYRKAFWVIGAAAITTILALSPLIVLSLGQLKGFAIFTIVGIIVGVGITRPIYSDILNYLLVKREQ